jgi:hypothetical protein
MRPTTLTSIQELQTALDAKAKESSDVRFYALYDKVLPQGCSGVCPQTLQSQPIEWRHNVHRVAELIVFRPGIS